MPLVLRRPYVVVVVGLVVGICCGLAYVLLTRGEDNTTRQPAVSGGTSPGGTDRPADTVSPSERDVARLESAVTSGSKRSIREAFGIPLDQELETTFTSAVKKWRTLEIDLGTYEATGPDVGVADAELTATAGESSRWRLALQRRPDGGWFIVTTEEVVE